MIDCQPFRLIVESLEFERQIFCANYFIIGFVGEETAQNVREAAKAQGLDRFMLETDAPYLTPMPHRGKPNEPAYIRHTAEFAAKEVFGISYQYLADASTANAQRFFGLKR